jgi:hypothetical protein
VAVLACAIAACGPSGQRASHEYAAGDTQNGLTIKVHVGDSVRVTLNSTEWTIAGSSDAAVLQQDGLQAVSPAPPGTCFPGEGCGTTSAHYRAVKIGTATVDASRVSCGEARVCVGTEGKYEVTVTVGA